MNPTHRVVDARNAGPYDLGDLVVVLSEQPDTDGDLLCRRVTDDLEGFAKPAALEAIVAAGERPVPWVGTSAPDEEGGYFARLASKYGLPEYDDLPLAYVLGLLAYWQGAQKAIDS